MPKGNIFINLNNKRFYQLAQIKISIFKNLKAIKI